METTSTIGSWGAAIVTSVATAMSMFVAAVPRIVGFLVILLVGWFIASLIGKAVAMLLRNLRFNELSQRARLSDFVESAGIRSDSSGFVAGVAKWIVRLVALVVAFDALGLPAVSQVLRELLLWLPNLVVAIVVLVVGGMAANAVSAVVRGATASARLGNPQRLARIASMAVWVFATVVAINQLGIATRLVNTLFMAATGALALALGLAFGLGGRETAGRIVNDWYQRSQRALGPTNEALTSGTSPEAIEKEAAALRSPAARTGQRERA
jgi:hypothetical protein